MAAPPQPVLSIIVPVYNERRTIEEVVRRVTAVPFRVPYELVIVDDGSTDGTGELLRSSFGDRHTVVTHPENRGKGAAIRTGLARSRGDVFVVQDADLEYDPDDLPRLLAALRGERDDVVYGSRVLGRTRKAYASFVFHLGGLLVTWWTNVLYGSHLTDEATGYKMFTRRALNAITLERSGFDLEPELTGKLLRAGFAIHEVPIAYHPRTRGEGKKIKLRDGVIALWTLVVTRMTAPRRIC